MKENRFSLAPLSLVRKNFHNEDWRVDGETEIEIADGRYHVEQAKSIVSITMKSMMKNIWWLICWQSEWLLIFRTRMMLIDIIDLITWEKHCHPVLWCVIAALERLSIYVNFPILGRNLLLNLRYIPSLCVERFSLDEGDRESSCHFHLWRS